MSDTANAGKSDRELLADAFEAHSLHAHANALRRGRGTSALEDAAARMIAIRTKERDEARKLPSAVISVLETCSGYLDGMTDDRVDHNFDDRQKALLKDCLVKVREVLGVVRSGPSVMHEIDRLSAINAELVSALSAIIAAEDLPADFKDPAANRAYIAAFTRAIHKAREVCARSTVEK